MTSSIKKGFQVLERAKSMLIVTGGTNVGVMKLTGEFMADTNVPLIGIGKISPHSLSLFCANQHSRMGYCYSRRPQDGNPRGPVTVTRSISRSMEITRASSSITLPQPVATSIATTPSFCSWMTEVEGNSEERSISVPI
jgi:hypothetical protein